jgi:protein translocase SecG subunit
VTLSPVTILAQLATPAPAGAVAAKAATGLTQKLPSANATLSPDLLKQLQAFQYAHKSTLATNAPWLTHTFAAIFLILAVGLIVLLAFQTTKQEGLSGTIGGRVESAYRPRLGFDQQLARLTSYVAIGMVFFAVILSITGI